MKPNLIKMYDKFSYLRVKMVINSQREFKVYKNVAHADGSTSKQWGPIGKLIANLYRYVEVSKATNKRLLNSLQNIIPAKSLEKEVNELCGEKTYRKGPIPIIMSGHQKHSASSKSFRIENI